MPRGRKRNIITDVEDVDLPPPTTQSVSAFVNQERDGLPTRSKGEDPISYEARLANQLPAMLSDPLASPDSLQYTILLEYIRHLTQGKPHSTFVYRNESGLILCDSERIDLWEEQATEAFVAMQQQIDIARRQSEARWIEHLANVAAGRSVGNVKALEMYAKRFFGWDVDRSSEDLGKSVRSFFANRIPHYQPPVEIVVTPEEPQK